MPPFDNCKSSDGFLTLTRLLTSLSLASISATFDLALLYLNVIDYRTISSLLAMNSAVSSSINLNSFRYIKSSLADPSRFITNTARKQCGSLIQEFIIF